MKKAAESCQKIDSFFRKRQSSEKDARETEIDPVESPRMESETMTSETSGTSKSASQSTVKCTGPKYPDMGELSREDLTRDNNVKLNIIKTKWENVDDFPFPAR